MSNDELKAIAKHPDIPDLDVAVRERIVTAAVRHYRRADETSNTTSGFGDWLAGVFKPAVAVAAGLVLVVAVQVTRAPDINTDHYNGAIFEEFQLLFQHELRAVVARNGDIDVVLGGQDVEQTNPLVFIRIEADGQPVYITAYSGQTIEAEIGGKKVSLDILTTSDQNVLVAADEFMLENDTLHGPDNFHANAHVLETGL